MSPAEVGVLAVLVLRGAQTTNEVRTRAERHLEGDDGPVSADEVLDALAARSPDPFAVRLERRPGEREARWAHALTDDEDGHADAVTDRTADPAPPTEAPRDHDLARDVAELWAPVERLSAALGLDEDVSSS